MEIKKEHDKHIVSIAGKLLAEGLTAKEFTKTKAKKLTRNVIAKTYVHKMIGGFSSEIKKEMLARQVV